MKTAIAIAIVVAYGLICTGCAGGMSTLYSVEGKREIKVRISAGGLGEILSWESTYEGKPAEVAK